MIKLSKYIIVSMLLFGASVAAEEGAVKSNLKASVNAGYTSNYIVNGLAKTGSQAFAGVDISTVYQGFDTYVGAVVLDAGAGIDQLHANVGVGKGLIVNDTFTLRLDAQVFQHQVAQGANSTEGRLTAALENKYVTPYVIGTYDLDVANRGFRQEGYILGLRKTFNVYDLFNLTPSVEYGQMTDYDTVSAKVDVSKQLWENLQVFGQFGWYDNNFDVANYNFATEQFVGDLAGSAGVRWNF